MFKKLFLGANSKQENDICSALQEVSDRIYSTQNLFENSSEPDLIDACIYELKALNARREHLFKLAKEENVTCNFSVR